MYYNNSQNNYDIMKLHDFVILSRYAILHDNDL